MKIFKTISNEENLFNLSLDNSPSNPLDFDPQLLTGNVDALEDQNLPFSEINPLAIFPQSPTEQNDLPQKRRPFTENDSLHKKTRMIKKEPKQEPSTITPPSDEKHIKRLIANKKSAQASRQRKKVLKADLEEKFEQYTTEHEKLKEEVISLETENRLLKTEFLHVQKMITDSPFLTKFLMAQLMNLVHENPQALKIPSSTVANNPGQMASMVCLLMILHSFGPFFKQIREQELLVLTASKIESFPWVM